MHGSLGREPGWSRPRVQISVVVANIRTRPSKTEVEKGSVPTAVEHGSVGPKTQAKVFPKGAGSVSLANGWRRRRRSVVVDVVFVFFGDATDLTSHPSSFSRKISNALKDERPAFRRKGIGLIFPNPDSESARGWRRCWQRCRWRLVASRAKPR